MRVLFFVFVFKFRRFLKIIPSGGREKELSDTQVSIF